MSQNKKLNKLVDLVLNYSVEIQKGDKLLIQFNPAYSEYAILLGRNARKKGAEVRYDSMSFDPRILRKFIENNNQSEWQEELKRRIELAKWCNARILVDCDSNPNYADGIENSEAKIINFNKKVIGPYKKILYRKGKYKGYAVKWNLTGFPSKENAELTGMSIDEFEKFVYAATLENDWLKMSNEMKKVKTIFDNAKDVHIIVPGLTDLHLSLKGRGGEICDGKLNMPDGEVFYGPIEDSVNGYIYFQVPAKREGFGILEGIRLEFKNGAIRKFSAKKNQKALEETLKIDVGIKRVGEFGIGCNYGIKKAIIETLFDEKIGGTIHLALGDSYREQPLNSGGGLNKSDIHWDLVCDLRRNISNLSEFPGGEIYVNGKLVQKNGIWQF